MPDIQGYADAVANRAFGEVFTIVPPTGNRLRMGPPVIPNDLTGLSFPDVATSLAFFDSMQRSAGPGEWAATSVAPPQVGDSILDRGIGGWPLVGGLDDVATRLGQTRYLAVVVGGLSLDGLIPASVLKDGDWWLFQDGDERAAWRVALKRYLFPGPRGPIAAWVSDPATRLKLTGPLSGDAGAVNGIVLAPANDAALKTDGTIPARITSTETDTRFGVEGTVTYTQSHNAVTRWDARLAQDGPAIRWRERAWEIGSAAEVGRRKFLDMQLSQV